MSRIGIIGAGPGGLSLARLLTERKLADVVVLERAPRVGGKSLTVTRDGLGHDMGTCYVTAGYTSTRDWMREAGMTTHRLKHHLIHKSEGEVVDFKEYVLGGGSQVKAGVQMAAYVSDWLSFHEWDIHGCANGTKGTRDGFMRDEMAMPFGKWLEQRDLDVIARFALRTISIMGYGGLDKVPALYGLRWNVPSLIWSAVTLNVAEPVPGWQHLWAHVASQLDVRLNHAISEVTRDGGRYRVKTDRGDLAFDHLVISTPLDEAQAWFPFTAEEKESYAIGDGRLGWNEYVTTLVDVEGWFQKEDTHSFEAAANGSAAMSHSRLMVARRTADKTPAAAARSQTRRDVYVCYQAGNTNLSNEELVAILRRDILAQGGKNVKVLRQCRWHYAPQLTEEAIRAGVPHAMERQQGKDNLWITGATVSQESVDNIVDFNERLADRIVMAHEGQDPSSDRALAEVAAKYRWRTSDK